MKDLTGNEVMNMPRELLTHTSSTFLSGGSVKWIPAALVALFTDIGQAFSELFWVVVGLWLLDFVIGFTRAIHDPKVELAWSKAFGSVLKLFIIALSVPAMHLIERLIAEAGVDIGYKLTSAVLIVIGVSEAGSILGNLVYFWPGLGELAEKVKGLLGQAKDSTKK